MSIAAEIEAEVKKVIDKIKADADAVLNALRGDVESLKNRVAALESQIATTVKKI